MASKWLGWAVLVFLIVLAIALYFVFVDDKVMDWKANREAATTAAV